MPEEPDELRILVHESGGADFRARGSRAARRSSRVRAPRWPPTWRRAAARPRERRRRGAAGAARRRPKPPTPANGQIEQGDLLVSNWVDYSDPNNYKGYQKATARRSRSRATAPMTSCWPSCGPAAPSTTSSCRPATPRPSPARARGARRAPPPRSAAPSPAPPRRRPADR